MKAQPRYLILAAFASVLLYVLFCGTAVANSNYGGCESCHGGFREDNYVSKTDGAAWGNDLMDGHSGFGITCNACHNSGGFDTVYLNSSSDGTLSKSCVGCHGRQEDVNGSCVGGSGEQVECGSGAGLRQHHATQGASNCGSCHSGDPTPTGEDTNPFNYGLSGVVMMNACDSDGSESQFGSAGLDNDGDGQVDGNDSDCQSNSLPTQPGTLSASSITTNSATVSWIASTDADGDTITYHVEYKQNGAGTWSDGGSTTSLSRALTGLAADQAYDVQVTPNDGTGDGPARQASSLFQTEAGANNLPTQPGTLSASAVTSSSATVSWGASTDADGDTITYHVEYKQNGAGTWSDGGSTTSLSRALTGLVSDQAYDVQVTPNDGSGDGLARTQSNLFQTESASQPVCAETGALAYANWTKTDAGGSGSLPSGETNADYVRCKACHGWDHMGTDGGYVRRSREATRPNAGAGDGDQTSRNISLAKREGALVTSDMILHAGTGRTFAEGSASWVDLDATHSVDNKVAHASGYTLGNQHPDYSGGQLTQAQVDCLVEFLNSADADPTAYFDSINPSTNPVQYTIKTGADAVAGEAFYNLSCSGCHGDPATDYNGGNGGKPSGGILKYLEGDGKFSEFAHVARWGIPNTAMTRSALGSPSAQNIADTMLYLQKLGGTGFAINPGHSGNWWGGLGRAGEGFLIDVALDNNGNIIIVVSFYTYDSMGNQAWLIGSGAVDSDTAEITMTIPEGAQWGDDFDPNDVPYPRPEWGIGIFRFTSCYAGSVELLPNLAMQNRGFTELRYALNRDILIPGIACPTPASTVTE